MSAAVIYCRCSTEEESQVDALKKQVIEAEACVRDNQWVLVDRYVESRSGTTSKGRGEYRRLFDDMLTEKFDIIVIKSQDRLMRNTKDWYLFLDRLLTHGKKLYLYLDRKFYSTDDALITGIKAILAEEYSRELSKKIVNAHRHRQQDGGRIMLTNHVFGFQKEADGSVSIVEAEAEIIRQIYGYCASGYGCRTISNILEKEEVKSRNDKYMNPGTIRRMIRNPLYKGIFVMNRQHFDFETKQLKKNPEEEWIYKEGIVPAIVDTDLWERANLAISSRAKKNNRSKRYARGNNSGKYILSGKIVCGKCGHPYYRTWRRSVKDPEKIIYEWKCSEYLAHGRATKKRRDCLRKISVEDVNHLTGCDGIHLDEEIVFGLLEQLGEKYSGIGKVEKEKIAARTIELLEKALNKNPREKTKLRLTQKMDDLLSKKQFLLDKLLDGIISDSDYKRQNEIIEKKLSEVREEKGAFEKQVPKQKSIECRIEEIRKRLVNGGIEKAAARQILNGISHIIVHEWQLEIQLETLQKIPVFMDYPFHPNTEKGRIRDQQWIMEYIKAHPEATVKEMAVKQGRTVSVIRNRMDELIKSGYIHFEGKGGQGKWVIQKGKETLQLYCQKNEGIIKW